MANDHYIPRFLTKPWEYLDRQLHYFDFVTGEFEDQSSRNLFAKSDLNTPTLEILFRDVIETPGGAHITNIVKADRLGPGPADWETRRALALLMFLSPARIDAAQAIEWTPDGEGLTPDVLERGGEAFLDRVAAHFLSRFRVFAIEIPADVNFFFPETCGFAIPVVGNPIIAVPIGLRHALLSREGPIDQEEIGGYAERGILAALSVGLATHCRRVVLPPRWRDLALRDKAGAAQELRALRENAQQLFNAIGQASQSVGLPAWHVTPPRTQLAPPGSRRRNR